MGQNPMKNSSIKAIDQKGKEIPNQFNNKIFHGIEDLIII